MQINLNKIPFDVAPVDEGLRAALLKDPQIARGSRRDVWSWDRDAGVGSFLVPVGADKALPLPTGVSVFVPRAGSNGAAVLRADGPTGKMAERFLAALGTKSFGPVLQAMARVTGIAPRPVPFEAFAALNALGSYTVRMDLDFAVAQLSNSSRNLTAYVFVPSLVGFSHTMVTVPEGAPAPGSIRPGFVVSPPTQAAGAIRRLALVRRMQELQARLGEVKPADLPESDPLRTVAQRLGVEWRALQPKPKAAA